MIVPILTPARKALVDEYKRVRDKVEAWRPAVNPHAARHAEIEAEILSWVEDEAADQEILLVGNTVNVPISARRKRHTIIHLPQLFKKLGLKWISEHCKPTLGDLKKSPLPPQVLEKFIKETQDGGRTIGEPVVAQPNSKAVAA